MDTAKLLYFAIDTDGDVTKPPHPELGAALSALKAARGVSQQRLAKLAGVSRRHVALALSGGNITITILKKLLSALHATDIALGPLATAHGTLDGLNPSVLLAAAQQIEQGVTLLAATAANLRGHASVSSARPLDPEAAALVDQFIARVQTITDPEELAALRRAMDETSRGKDPELERPRESVRTSRKRAKTA